MVEPRLVQCSGRPHPLISADTVTPDFFCRLSDSGNESACLNQETVLEIEQAIAVSLGKGRRCAVFPRDRDRDTTRCRNRFLFNVRSQRVRLKVSEEEVVTHLDMRVEIGT